MQPKSSMAEMALATIALSIWTIFFVGIGIYSFISPNTTNDFQARIIIGITCVLSLFIGVGLLIGIWIDYNKKKRSNFVYQFMKSAYHPIPKIEDKEAFRNAINNKAR